MDCKDLKMEHLPSLAEFETLLQEDSLFRDYFNTFLNLPVFAKRLTYCCDTRKFLIEPRVDHLLQESDVLSWALCTRFPLFWSSDLHLEYRLSLRLTKANPLAAADVCSVSAMDKFRKCVCQTEGESSWLFWKDIERLKIAKDKQLGVKIFHYIQLMYLQNGALVTLPKCVKEQAVLSLRTECRSELLFNAQELALEELIKYWSLRYNIHSKDFCKNISQTFSKELGCDKTYSEQHQALLPLASIPGHTSSESENGRPVKEAILPCTKINTGGNQLPKKVSHIKLKRLSLPTLVVTDDEKEATKIKQKCAMPLITPSTQSFLPLSTEQSSNLLLQDLPTLPYLCAFLRTDSLSERPFLHYLNEHARPACSHLLFWQSVEVLLAQDEMKRWCTRNPSKRCDQLVFFEEYPVARDLCQLVEMFLGGHAPYRVELPQNVKRRELCALVERGLGHNLLLIVQEHSAKMLFTLWQAYLLEDHRSFTISCTPKKTLRQSPTLECSPSPGQLLETVFNPPSLHSAWRALRYAEAAKYNGIHLLPSRCYSPTLLLTPPTAQDKSILDIACAESPPPVDDDALSLMVTSQCDALTWKRTKLTRTLCYTTTQQFDTNSPPIPFHMLEILNNPNQLEFFRHYLFMHGLDALLPLQFWMAVEEIKLAETLGKMKFVSYKIRQIQERFLVGKETGSLLSTHPVFLELSKYNRLSVQQLIQAQEDIVRSLEKKWLKDYVAYLNSKVKEVAAKAESKRPLSKRNTRGLWTMFVHNVISFRRGLMSVDTAKQFREYLRNEAVKGYSGQAKIVIGARVIHVTKLLCDLSFWAEVERYKDLMDLLWTGKQKGCLTPEDDIMLHKKAIAIVNCYIDSSVAPKVQINIPSNLVTSILQSVSKGQVTRGLFHKAALSIFSVLILFWKRFCIYRFSPKKRLSVARKQSRSIVPVNTIRVRNEHQYHAHHFWDGGPILSYNMIRGVKWLFPPKASQPSAEKEQDSKNTSKNTSRSTVVAPAH